MQSVVGNAVAILLITCAGGTFSRILFQTNVSSLLNDLSAASPVVKVLLHFS